MTKLHAMVYDKDLASAGKLCISTGKYKSSLICVIVQTVKYVFDE